MKRVRVTVPTVTKTELLGVFNHMCAVLGKQSLGFNPDLINGADQWAMKYTPKCGWMVVSGLGGCGAALSRWNGYMQTRWNFLMMMEAVRNSSYRTKAHDNARV
jgi:hypothetical protein